MLFRFARGVSLIIISPPKKMQNSLAVRGAIKIIWYLHCQIVFLNVIFSFISHDLEGFYWGWGKKKERVGVLVVGGGGG